MPDGTPPPTTASNDARMGGGARPLVERQLEALGELVDIGLNIARAIDRQVGDESAGRRPLAELNAAAMAYARVARAVRQSILLQTRLVEGPRAGDKAGPATGAERKAAAEARVTRALRREIEAEHDDPDQVERLAAEAAERLERDLDGEALDRPLHEIVADICRDLGLRPDWPRLWDELSAAEDILGDGDAASLADAPEKIELYWLDQEGWPTPASQLCGASRWTGRRRDSS